MEILVYGTGLMGKGISLVFAKKGHSVLLYNPKLNSSKKAYSAIESNLIKLVSKNKLSEILRNTPDNVIIMNNVSSLNLYLNKVDRCFTDLRMILDKDQMNSYNDTTYNNISILSDLFNIKIL